MPNQAPIFSAPTFSLRRVSVTPSGVPNEGTGFNGAGDSLTAASGQIFSPDGLRLLFSSDASNLVAGDTNQASDIFLVDLATGAMSRVSISGSNAQSTGPFGSYNATFSPDGSKILFESGANNLAAIDNNGALDLFVKDLATGAVTAMSQAGGVTVGGHGGIFSPDGSRVAFVSASSVLVPGDNNGLADIFIRDLATGSVSRVSIGATGQEGTGPSWSGSSEPVFSPDGTKILFASMANLLPGDSSTKSALYVKDLVTGALTLVSTDSGGTRTDGFYQQASWSPDGIRIIFTSSATTLVAGDTNGAEDVFVKNLMTGAVTRVSIGANGQELLGPSGRGSFSPDGMRILFQTDAEPIPTAFNGNRDVFIRDLASGAVTLISMSEDGGPGNSGASAFGRFSPDGTRIAFTSSAFGLTDGPAGQYVYVASIGSNGPSFRENGPAVAVVGVVEVADDQSHFGAGSLQIAISQGAGSGDLISLAAGDGVAINGSQVTVNGTFVATLSGTAQSIHLALNDAATAAVIRTLSTAVRFSNSSEDPGSHIRQIRFTLVDGGGTAEGGQDRAEFTRTVDVVAQNDRPTQSDQLISIVEEGRHVFRASDFRFSDGDGDAFLAVELFTQNVDPVIGRFLFDADGAGGAAPVAFVGPEIAVADIEAGKLVFLAGEGFSGDVNFGFRVRDDGGSDGDMSLDRAASSSMFTFRISAENDPPLVTTTPGTTNFVEGANGPADVAIDLGLTLRDPDDPNAGAIRSATVQISGNYQPGEDRLGLPNIHGFEGSFDLATGTLRIIAPSPVDTATWQLVLANVRYSNLSDAPSTLIRTVTIRASDGVSESLPVTKSISITTVNDAPAVDLNGAGADTGAFTIYTERAPAILIAPDAVVADLDSLNIAGGILRLERFANGAASDQLGIQNQGQGAGQIGVSGNFISYGGVVVASFVGGGADNLVVTFNDVGTPAAAQALLRALTYFNASSSPPNPGPAYRVTLSDGDGGTSAATFLNVGMILLPDLTELDLNGAAPGLSSPVTYIEGQDAFEVAPDAILTDADTQNFANFSLNVTLRGAAAGDNLTLLFGDGVTGLALDGDHLAFGGMLIGRISIQSPTAFSLLIDQSFVPLEAIQAVIRAVGYVNTSQDPATRDRFLRFRLIGPGEKESVQELLIKVEAVEDAPVAAADAVSVGVGSSVTFSVLANDSDADGGAKTIVTLAGSPASVGTPITLASGATLTLNQDGSLTYNPGSLSAGATDSFAYALNGGSSANVSIKVYTRGADGRLIGTAAADELDGGLSADLFDLSTGGADTVRANEGSDGVYFGAAFTAEDSADGGAGIDSLALQGSYSGLTLGAIQNFEVLVLLTGSDTRFGDVAGNRYSYDLATRDANVGAGAVLTIQAETLLTDESLTFNGAAEQDGQFRIFAGRGQDRLTGGGASDGFFFGAQSNLTGADRIDGGQGVDSVALRGNYFGETAVRFEAQSLVNVETLVFLSGHTKEYGGLIVTDGFDYEVTMVDANLSAGRRLDVIATGLRSNESLAFDGQAETDGAYRILSGAGDDRLVGGSGNDTIYGGLGADRLQGGGGADLFIYRAAAESQTGTIDQIIGFETGDRIDLSVIDAVVGTVENEGFAFIGSTAFSQTAGQLRAVQVEGGWRIEGDVNGDGIADLVIGLTTPKLEIIGSDFFL